MTDKTLHLDDRGDQFAFFLKSASANSLFGAAETVSLFTGNVSPVLPGWPVGRL